MNKQAFKGTGRIARLYFRENRFKIFIWLVSLAGISWAVAAIYPSIFSTQEDLTALAVTMGNPAMEALLGPAYSIENFNVGTAFASEMLLFTAVAVGVMNILLMISNTRTDEEEGRLEIIRSLPVGRLANLTASILMILGINLVLFLALGFGIYFIGPEAMTWGASFLYAAVQAVTGLFFAGVALITAQLAETSRGANGLALGFLILSYIVRAIGDVTSNTLSLFSPLGWTVRTEVFLGNEWWPVLALSAGFLLLTGVSFILNYRRDIFSGLLPTVKGKVHASRFLKTMPGFVWRLEKNTIITWALGLFLLSAAFGAILGDFETYFSDMEIIQEFLPDTGTTSSMVEQFTALIIAIMSLITGVPVISILFKVKKEEKLGRMEHLYSRPVSRNKVLGSYYLVAFLTTIVIQGLIGLGLYVTADQVLAESLSFSTMMQAAFVYIPALWIFLGLATLIVGILPKGTMVVWLYVLFVFVVLYLGDIFEFPEWVNNLSAFNHIPQLPDATMDWPPMLTLSGLSILLSAVGFISYNRRDISE